MTFHFKLEGKNTFPRTFNWQLLLNVSLDSAKKHYPRVCVFSFSLFIYNNLRSTWMWEWQTYQWVPCTVHRTHYLLESANFALNMSHQWVPCTVHGTKKSFFSITFLLKIGLTTLFTYLKIILLQYFQFSAK